MKKTIFPLAMPSANISSSVSPVSAEDVADEFKNSLKFILDGGKSKIGIESTVIDLTGKPTILRPGIIDSDTISNALKTRINYSKNRLPLESHKRHLTLLGELFQLKQ